MTFLRGAATIAAMTLGLVGAGTPGFALDRPASLPRFIPVPQPLPPHAARPLSPAVPEQADQVPANQIQADQAVDTPDYASLSEAVAAQDTDIASDEPGGDELACMAGAVYFEAKGEPLEGQLAVADVILNRTRSGRFPASVCSVVTQHGQFSFVRDGRIPAISGNAAYRTAVAVARVAMTDGWESAAHEAMYFHARRVAPAWRMTRVASIGNQVFYR